MEWPCEDEFSCTMDNFQSYYKEWAKDIEVEKLAEEYEKITQIMNDPDGLSKCTTTVFKHPGFSEYIAFCLPNTKTL